MNEIKLNSLVSEIKFFENQAVVSYWEIGKRLLEAKKQVEHGKWGEWLKNNLNYSLRTGQQLIKVYEDFPNTKLISHLNFTQVLALTGVNEEVRNEILENENLEDKTVKETKKIIRKYKSEAEDLREENEGLKRANEELSRLAEKEPQIIEKTVTKTVEIKPKDYDLIKKQNAELQAKNEELELRAKVSKMDDNKEVEAIKSELRNYKWLVLNFVKNTTPLLNLVNEIKLLPKNEQDLMKQSTKNLLGFATNLYEQIKGV